MTTHYVVLEDMNYNNNFIRFISLDMNLAIKWCLLNTNPKKQNISLVQYDMSDDSIVKETDIVIPYTL